MNILVTMYVRQKYDVLSGHGKELDTRDWE